MLRCEEKQHRIFSIGPDHQNSLRKKIIRICYKPAEKNISSGLLTGALTSGLVWWSSHSQSPMAWRQGSRILSSASINRDVPEAAVSQKKLAIRCRRA